MTDSHPSFRDPAGFCWSQGGRILRAVASSARAEVDQVLATAAGTTLDGLRGDGENNGPFPREAAPALRHGPYLADAALYEHERIPFPSYPYEWSPEMLAAAGLTYRATGARSP
jgi:hypothetical protein